MAKKYRSDSKIGIVQKAVRLYGVILSKNEYLMKGAL